MPKGKPIMSLDFIVFLLEKNTTAPIKAAQDLTLTSIGYSGIRAAAVSMKLTFPLERLLRRSRGLLCARSTHGLP